MRWLPAFGFILLGALAGCRGNPSWRDTREIELRAREDDVRQLKSDLDRAEYYNHALSKELAATRGGVGPDGGLLKPSQPYPVRSLRLGRGTAGRAGDCGGDDALQVQVEPIDCENSTIKAPGSLFLEVMEINKEGLKSPLSSWDIPNEQLRHKWQSGLFNTGYIFNFPWKVAPCQEKLRVLARLTLVDGRVFEAEKDITVRLLPENRRRILLTEPTPAPSPTLPGPTEVMPGPGDVPPPSMDIPPPPIPPPGVTPIPTVPPKATPTSLEGPILSKGSGGPKVQLLRPVRMPTDDDPH